MTTTKDKLSYRELRDKLDIIMAWFDQDDLDIDEAMIKYAEAEKVIADLEAYLADTEQKIKKLKS